MAKLTDQMVRADLLTEETSSNPIGQSYSYKLSKSAQEQLRALKQGSGHDPAGLASFEALAKQLLNENSLPKLEYAATIAYFRRQGKDWPYAVTAAAKFKNLAPDGDPIKDAERLAREVLEAT